VSEDKPTDSPFKLNRGRIVLLVLGAVLVLIAISTAMGGMSSYQALKQANTAAKSAAPEQVEAQ
jgi:flagellar basal body-associated protein FliL